MITTTIAATMITMEDVMHDKEISSTRGADSEGNGPTRR